LAEGLRNDVTVIDGAGDSVLATVGVGAGPWYLAYNPVTNRIYCSNYNSDDVTVIDGATNEVKTTIGTGDFPGALCVNTENNLVFVVNLYGPSVTVIDGASNHVIATVAVDDQPYALCYNPQSSRVYCANYFGSSISVLHAAPGVEETMSDERGATNVGPTIIRGVLLLPEAKGDGRQANGVLIDAMGRKVLDLHHGPNDVRSLVPGVYFVRAVSRELLAVSCHKVVVTK